MALNAARLRLPRSPVQGSELAAAVERRLGLTTNGMGLVVVAVACFTLARIFGNPAIYMFTWGLVLVGVSAFIVGARRPSVSAVRSALPGRVRVGQVVSVELELTARRRVSTILVEEELHPHLGSPVRLPIPLLPAGSEAKHPYVFTPHLRGVYTVGPLVASWTDPFGLSRKRTVLSEAVEIIVHPSTELAHDRVLSRAWEDPPIRPPVSKPWPSGFEFYGMRDYEPGDDPRRIVWRATARTLDPDTGAGRYLVRESEQGITDRISIIMDTDAEWHSPGEVSETFETAVRAVASLGARHLKEGFAVTAETNSGRIGDSLRGPRSRIALLDEMARVQRETASLHEVLDRFLRNPRRDTHVIVVTPYLDREAAIRLRLLMTRGVSLLLVLVLWDNSEPEALHRAGALGCNVVEVTSTAPLEVVFRRIMSGGRR